MEKNIDISDVGWFFTAAYQSTDESDTTPVLDPNTDVDEGDEIPVSLMLKPWITHPPLYQTAPFDKWVLNLDGVVMESQKLDEKDHRGKAAPHPHRCSHPVDAPLSKLEKKNVKIPRYAIDKFWLENHPECLHSGLG
ncbi:hypothetical protein L208DRAFT_1381380 [Tricholoma matsutake]|nr:hypothetical protein L208DRAFT_1381380 [Tricholoma matsutake 945]